MNTETYVRRSNIVAGILMFTGFIGLFAICPEILKAKGFNQTFPLCLALVMCLASFTGGAKVLTLPE